MEKVCCGARTRLRLSRLVLALLVVGLGPAAMHAKPADSESFFEKKVRLARDLGATFVTVTEGLPPAMWQLPPDDPYPGWFIYRPSLLKIFPPKDVRPYVNGKYADRIAGILEGRCKILQKYG